MEMLAKALGKFAMSQRELEESHELVHFGAPDIESITKEQAAACEQVINCVQLRHSYQSVMVDVLRGQDIAPRLALDDEVGWAALESMPHSVEHNADGVLYVPGFQVENLASYERFSKDREIVLLASSSGPLKSFSYQRLKLLEHRFECYLQLNKTREQEQTKGDRMDWSKVAKVDTHIHLAAAFTTAHLFRFIQQKLMHCPDDIVAQKEGKGLTLRSLFVACNIDPANLTMASLDTQADLSTFNRFDNFNGLYNPFGDASLRAVFMKTDSANHGQYFAELTKELLLAQESPSSNNIKSEFRISIYGRRRDEWNALAEFVVTHNLFSESNRFLVQIPRLYDMWRKQNAIKSMSEMLDNIFQPLYECTLRPNEHRKLHLLLSQCTGFDCVDDESRADTNLPHPSAADPRRWESTENPPYAYWLYCIYAHLVSLNKLRKARGFHEFSFRPHCGESGSATHLADAFLLATNINHGINLQKNTPLQYLYFLTQVGLAVSPLSNAALFLDYDKNPFSLFFKRGLNVSLSTDDPLQFSYTRYPLIEEYSVAKARFNLSQVDLSEISANSVRQSGFEHRLKAEFLGSEYFRTGLAGNDVDYSNVPDLRVLYRSQTWDEEIKFVQDAAALSRRVATRTDSMVVAKQSGVESLLFSRVTTEHVAGQNGPSTPSLTPSTAHKRRVYVKKKTQSHEEDSVNCSKLIRMIELRNKYWKAPDHLPHKTLTESKEMGKLSRRLLFRNGVFRILKSEGDLCSHDQVDTANVRCTDCNKSYCSECFRVLHRHPAMVQHKSEPLEPIVPLYAYHTLNEFVSDFQEVVHLASNGPTASLSKRRLKLLSVRFDAHVLLNGSAEKNSMKNSPKHFTTMVKVDNHLHTSSCATAHHLLQFVKRSYEEEKDTVVLENTTLGQVVERVAPNVELMTLDSLGMNDGDYFGRFDKWNALYLPFQDDAMRQTFLRRENLAGGRFYASLIKEVVAQQDPLVHTELRLTVRGSHPNEWTELANWIFNNGLHKLPRNAFVVQVPRAYRMLFKKGIVKSFGELLENIFRPLFEVVLEPSRNERLFDMIFHVAGFDSVDDETGADTGTDFPADPFAWTKDPEPPYSMWLYFLKANMETLNRLKAERGMRPFSLRPHSGASGTLQHPCAAFLLADSIVHGLTLVATPSLHYCYYLCQIGIVQAVLAENSLYVKIRDNPFYEYFKQGMVVTLSTDNPRAIHLTPEPLLEEYAVAVQTWRLRAADQAELARNSILISGFSDQEKTTWLGPDFHKKNDPAKSGISDIRAQYRQECLQDERSFVLETACGSKPSIQPFPVHSL